MERRIKPTTSTKELTSNLAEDIYSAIIKHGSADLAFKAKETDFDYENIVLVDKMIDHLFGEMEVIASGRKIITEAVAATLDEDGIEVEKMIPAVYYVPSSKTDFKLQFDSGLLNSTDVLSDFVNSKGFDYKGEWNKFINSYNG